MTQSRRLTPDEIRDLLASHGDEAREVLAAMFPPSTDTSRLFAAATRPPAPVARAPLPFIPRPGIDENQLADFNDRFKSRLAAPVSVDAARSMDFQTHEDWNGYVTSGAADFVLGEAVARPLKLGLPDAARDATFPLRPGHDPAAAPLRLGLFADFGNGLRASREVARRVIDGGYPYAFHLGDVYYDGNPQEFREFFEEPLAPLLPKTELFMLSGNHEMYSKGVNFQKYLQRKAAQHPGLQRQNAELFRLRGHGLQIIGLDTMWCHWEGKLFRGNEPRLDAPTRALLEQWLTEGDPDDLTILLTSNEPFSIESDKTTKMLEDLRPFVERGLVDLWFWGNVHHAAIFDGWKVPGSPEHGFIGACVGHGGYPFYTQREADVPKGVSCRWWEDKHRFWPYDGVRPDVGLNGLAELSISRSTAGWEVGLTYRDWVGRDRARATIRKPRGMGPQLVAVAENLSPSLGGADWRARPDPGARGPAPSRAPRGPAATERGPAGGLAEPRAPWPRRTPCGRRASPRPASPPPPRSRRTPAGTSSATSATPRAR
ncbi:MAG: metallophosphoesterase [Polyangiales bacterium]